MVLTVRIIKRFIDFRSSFISRCEKLNNIRQIQFKIFSGVNLTISEILVKICGIIVEGETSGDVIWNQICWFIFFAKIVTYQSFLQVFSLCLCLFVSHSIFLCLSVCLWMHYMDANKTAGEEARRQLHKNGASNSEQVLAATPRKTPTIRPPASHHENYPS